MDGIGFRNGDEAHVDIASKDSNRSIVGRTDTENRLGLGRPNGKSSAGRFIVVADKGKVAIVQPKMPRGVHEGPKLVVPGFLLVLGKRWQGNFAALEIPKLLNRRILVDKQVELVLK